MEAKQSGGFHKHIHTCAPAHTSTCTYTHVYLHAHAHSPTHTITFKANNSISICLILCCVMQFNAVFFFFSELIFDNFQSLGYLVSVIWSNRKYQNLTV